MTYSESKPKIVVRSVVEGFGSDCRRYLSPVFRNGRKIPPNPDCVRKVLKDERPSRKMLVNIFANCPKLLHHPLTSPHVRALYQAWRLSGTIPDGYGRGMPQMRAADCVTIVNEEKKR